MTRISMYVLAFVVAAGAFRAEVAEAKIVMPLQLTSLEWLVADSDVVVRGVVVDVAVDQSWNIVTLDVRETLKGAKAERLKFVVHRFDKVDAALAVAKQEKREQLWLLKRHDSGIPGEAPDREKVLARHKAELHAPFLPGRPGEPTLPVIPLGAQEGQRLPSLLTLDLRVLKTSDELVKAIRTAIEQTQGQARVHAYAVTLPKEVAQRTGFSYSHNHLTVPIDGRLEATARRLVQSPAGFVPVTNRQVKEGELSDAYLLRLEGVKALRLFPSEKNMAIVRAWLDDPMSYGPIKDARNTLAPAMPKGQQAAGQAVLPADLARVPEIHFQQPLTKHMRTMDAQLHTAVTIDSVHLLNQKKTDAYIEELMRKRPDLAGLNFAMGDACRMKPEASKNFVAALDVFRKAETAAQAQSGGIEKPAKESALMNRYKDQLKDKKVDPSASIASLMQVLGHEDATTRFGLAKYLDGLAHIDATRALAKLAIFSAEPEIRAAAVGSLQKRDHKDYTDVLLAGLNYPWPAVAERASEAMAKLGRKDLVPTLIDVLDKPDPRAPHSRAVEGKQVSVVRELVRVNHHHNCLLCHAPATTTRDNASKEEAAKLEGLTAQVPVPSESMVAYYRPSAPDILVRFDVTYLRQDFSMKLAVADAEPWPELQRYDFLVRTRELNAKEAFAYQELLQPALSPYRRAAVSALRELTGLDAEPTAAAWRKAISQ